MLSFNSRAPCVGAIHVNYYDEVAHVLSYLEGGDASEAEILSIIDPTSTMADRILNSAINIFAARFPEPVNVAWFQYLRTPDAIEISGDLMQFVNGLRLRDEEGVNAASLLFPPIWRAKSDVDAFIDHFLVPAVKSLSRRIIPIIIDLSQVRFVDKARVFALIGRLRRLSSQPMLARIRVFLISDQALGNTSRLEIMPLAPEFAELLDSKPQINPKTGGSHNSEALTTAIKPIAALNSGAERSAVEYLIAKHPEFKGNSCADTMWPLIQDGLARSLRGDGVGLSRTGSAIAAGIPGAETDFVNANGAKVLSFLAPESLIAGPSPLEALRKLTASSEFLVDAMATLATGLAQNQAEDARRVMDFAFDSSLLEDSLRRLVASRRRILHSYFGQLLLNSRIEEPRLFRVFEALTQGYADATASESGDAWAHHEAARAYYALYYVMDRLNDQRPKLFGDIRKDEFSRRREEYAAGSVRHQQNACAESTQFDLSEQLHYAWYLFDAGKTHEAAQTLFDLAQTAEAAERQAKGAMLDTLTDWALQRDEAAALGLALNPDSIFSSGPDSHAARLIKRYGGFVDRRALHAFLVNGNEPTPSFPISVEASFEDSIAIWFSTFDWLGALKIAESVAFTLGRTPILSPFGANFARKDGFEKRAAVDIVLGSPDSPGPVGAFIAEIDPSLSIFYHAHLGEDFALPVPAGDEDRRCVVLMGSGLCGIWNAWIEAVQDEHRFPFLQADTWSRAMPFDFGSSILLHVLMTASGRVTEGLVDALGRAVRARLDGAGEKVDEASLEQGLTLLRSSVGRHQEETTDSVFSGLTFAQRRAVLEYADMAGVLCLERSRLEAISSSGADIEPHDFQDSFTVMIAVCDAELSKDALRQKARQKLEHYRSYLRERERKATELQTGLELGRNLDQEIAGLEVEVRRILKQLERYASTESTST